MLTLRHGCRIAIGSALSKSLVSQPSRRLVSIPRHRQSLCFSPTQRWNTRQLSTDSKPTEEEPIAILGGGLSGLTVALHLSRALPSSRKIMLFEAQDRLGGWVQSSHVALPGADGTVVLEGGPRSIRPKALGGWKMMELIHSLNLMDKLIIVPKSHPSAKNRFIWFRGLNKLPSSLPAFLAAIFRLPVLRSFFPWIIPALIREPFVASRFTRPASESKVEIERQRSREYLLDESVESFIRRRFGDEFGGRLLNNMLSAVLHGIYASDTRSLSVRSTLPFLWETEQRHGSLLRAMIPKRWNKRYREPDEWQKRRTEQEEAEIKRIQTTIGEAHTKELEKASVFSFKGGVGDLVQAIEAELRSRPNVEIRMAEPVTRIQSSSQSTSDSSTELLLRTKQSASHLSVSRVISALPSSTLASIMAQPSKTLSTLLKANPSTNVGVVNFAIPASATKDLSSSECTFLTKRSQHPTHPGAFGFLVPRAENHHNLEGVLGVVFDSDAIPGQDDVPNEEKVTKLTVMIGGPHFLGNRSRSPTTVQALEFVVLPDEGELKWMARRALEKYLDIPEEVTQHPDTIVKATLQEKCIPIYLPGHFSRMKALHQELLPSDHSTGVPWKDGKLTVLGASYSGVALNDLVKVADQVARRIIREETGAASKEGDPITKSTTGLEGFDQDQHVY